MSARNRPVLLKLDDKLQWQMFLLLPHKFGNKSTRRTHRASVGASEKSKWTAGKTVKTWPHLCLEVLEIFTVQKPQFRGIHQAFKNTQASGED